MHWWQTWTWSGVEWGLNLVSRPPPSLTRKLKKVWWLRFKLTNKITCVSTCKPNSQKLSREKTFANFEVLWLFMKVFSVKFWGVPSFSTAKASNQWKFPPQIFLFSSFLPRKFPTIQYLQTHNEYWSYWRGPILEETSSLSCCTIYRVQWYKKKRCCY